ncbi:phosphotransferase enzyme [Aspergillus pseudoviridinutans]|uniref:Phosphotransferase enzyme n=1 Tax=Aspergillus pseudoviridinutans TaxID=1517512 RepID=A0A9P3EQ74_9EURO|nr:phosphotransferase enzyme [Aspergillus pseudoviridinutans]GIJ83906.1 phosphotransferase enzyme [Aspergillus pseudoviridinutans]
MDINGTSSYNETLRLAERQPFFNAAQLNRIAAASIGRPEQDVSCIRKLAEGGFNRVFEITMRDSTRVVARLLYPSTDPRIYATASEAATMEFLRLHGVPVPRILAYSATDQNPVASEYIIMEKAPGNELGELWYTMTERQRLKMIFEIVKIEALLFSIQLPGFESIYYEHDLPPCMRRIGVPQAGGNGRFCVGPDAHYMWWQKGRSSLSIERGPQSVAKRELEWLSHFGRARFPFERLYRELYAYQKVHPDSHVRNLRDYLQIARHLSPEKKSFLNRPMLRYPDLQPNNILVSDSFEVVPLIDWQHCSILPLLLQAGPPNYFQNYGDAVSENLIKPRLPSDFDRLGKNEQEAARMIFQRRQLHYYYFAATSRFNDDHFSAYIEDEVVPKQQLFQHAGDPWEGDSVTLRADLIRATQTWQMLCGSTDVVCPLHYFPEEIDGCLRLEEEQRSADDDMEKSRNCLGVSSDGWVPTERYSEAKRMSEKFREDAILLADSKEVAAQIQRHWPFDDYDEDE